MTTAQLAYWENWGKPEPIVERFDLLGILSHTKPNAIGLWPNEQLCLVWSAMQCDPNKLWVEVGSFCGGSTILLGYAQDALEGGGDILAIDAAFNPMFDLNIRRSRLRNIKKNEQHSYDALPMIKEPVSFAFLDGWHSFKSVVEEFEMLIPNLTDEAIIGFHDVSPAMWTHVPDNIHNSFWYSQENWNQLMSDESQDFRIDEAVAYICATHNYEIVDIPVRDDKTYFQETNLTEWVRGKTSPYNAYTAIRKIQ